jgi:hypothetical protein
VHHPGIQLESHGAINPWRKLACIGVGTVLTPRV